METRRLFSVVLALGVFAGCPSPSTQDAGTDAADVGAEAATDAVADVARDAPTDGPVTTQAGEPCTTSAMCGTGFDCLQGFVAGNLCSRNCVNNASQTVEQRTCGVGNTCLSNVDGDDNYSFCERACDPTAMPTGCRPGFICTGWWANHESGADQPGCWTFCSRDSDCPSGLHCNTYRGSCGAQGADLSLQLDGTPCNPMNAVGSPPQSTECRGFCLTADDTDPTRGICASQMDLAVNSACPDPSAGVLLTRTDGDNWGLCIYRGCTSDCDCQAPLACVPRMTASGMMNLCAYPAAGASNHCGVDAGTDASGDGAMSDSGDDASSDAAMDAGASE